MASEEKIRLVGAVAEKLAIQQWNKTMSEGWDTADDFTKSAMINNLTRAAGGAVAIIEPLIREQIAKEIEGHYLGPDSGRSPLDGREAPDAHLRNAYDEGLEVAVRIARGDHHE